MLFSVVGRNAYKILHGIVFYTSYNWMYFLFHRIHYKKHWLAKMRAISISSQENMQRL